ncbi:MAG TPA: carboxypeptidase-like regulatory domain-containing protein [Pseudomonadota bacterium]|nr:carboxypeptidase-like regulatory domain-containing protein [Pseudomonadota bacterium]
MRKASFLVALMLGGAVTTLTGCPEPETGTPEVPVDMTPAKAFHLTGVVVGTADQPLSNATIRVGTNAVTASGPDGKFSIDMAAPSGPVSLTISAAGYIPLVQMLPSDAMDVKYRLQRVAETSFPTSAVPLTVSDPASGAFVSIPADGLQGPGGVAPDGEITISIRFIDPSKQPMPGGDGALGTKNEQLALDPYGIVYTAARDSKGNVLSLKSGVTMTLYIPVPNDRLAMAPSEVGLWKLDSTKNAWVQDIGPSGTPTMLTRKNTSFTCRDKQLDPCDILACSNVSNQAWVGQASSFGFLNADVSFDKPACLRLDVQQPQQVCLHFEIPSAGSIKIKEHCYGQGSFALYNLPANMPISVKTMTPGAACSPDLSMGKMANPGDVWGGTGVPSSPSLCKGSITIPPTP